MNKDNMDYINGLLKSSNKSPNKSNKKATKKSQSPFNEIASPENQQNEKKSSQHNRDPNANLNHNQWTAKEKLKPEYPQQEDPNANINHNQWIAREKLKEE